MTTKVLITGSSGALGRVLTDRLETDLARYQVIAPRRGDAGDRLLDMRDAHRIAESIAHHRPEMILHLAATFSSDFEEAYSINVAAAHHILSTVAELALSTRVLLVGSAAEYGVVEAHENPVAESRVLRPVSVYGITKAWQTELAYLYAGRGVDVVVARIFNLVGPDLSERLFVGRLRKQIDEIRRGERGCIEVGSLSASRDYITIEDAATQLLAIAELGDPGKVYNVGSGLPITMKELLYRELAHNNLTEITVVEAAEATDRRGYDVPIIYADVSRIAELLARRGER